MPGINYYATRQRIRLADVLTFIGWQFIRRKDSQERGPCPIHRSTTPRSTVFAVKEEQWYCHKCKTGGDVFDLWAAVYGLPLHKAALDLCNQFHIAVVYNHRPYPFGVARNGEGER